MSAPPTSLSVTDELRNLYGCFVEFNWGVLRCLVGIVHALLLLVGAAVTTICRLASRVL